MVQLLDAKKDLEDQLLRMTAALLDYPAHRTGHSITSAQTGSGATTEAGGCGQLVKTGAADDVKTQDDHAYSEAGAAVGADKDHESSCDSGPDAANSQEMAADSKSKKDSGARGEKRGTSQTVLLSTTLHVSIGSYKAIHRSVFTSG